MIRILCLIFSVITFSWFIFMTGNFHSEMNINKLRKGSIERLNELYDIYNPTFYTKGHYKSKPFSYLIAKEYEGKDKFVQADSFYNLSLLEFPYEYEILRDYAFFQLRHNNSISKAYALATDAVSIKGFDCELNLLLCELEIYKGNYETALGYLEKVFHNDYILHIELLANEVFYQKYLFTDDTIKRNDSLNHMLSLIEVDSVNKVFLTNIKYSKHRLEKRIVNETSEEDFNNYMKERYTNFCHFYTSVWTKGFDLDHDDKLEIEKILLKYHTIKRRWKLLSTDDQKSNIEFRNSFESNFILDMQVILDDKQLKMFEPENKLRRLG